MYIYGSEAERRHVVVVDVVGGEEGGDLNCEKKNRKTEEKAEGKGKCVRRGGKMCYCWLLLPFSVLPGSLHILIAIISSFEAVKLVG